MLEQMDDFFMFLTVTTLIQLFKCFKNNLGFIRLKGTAALGEIDCLFLLPLKIDLHGTELTRHIHITLS